MDLVEVELARVVIHQKGDQQFIHLRERQGNPEKDPALNPSFL